MTQTKPKPLRGVEVASAAWPFAGDLELATTDQADALLMMKAPSLAIVVDGDPVPKARPRVFRTGGVVRTITPAKTVAYEALVKHAAMQSIARSAWPLGGWEDRRVRYVVRVDATMSSDRGGDADNVAKGILDALNGIVWPDDRRVCSLLVNRYVADDDDSPNTWVQVYAVGATKP